MRLSLRPLLLALFSAVVLLSTFTNDADAQRRRWLRAYGTAPAYDRFNYGYGVVRPRYGAYYGYYRRPRANSRGYYYYAPGFRYYHTPRPFFY